MIPRSDDGKIRILSLSYGKDSMACLGAIEQLGWPLDGIVTADVWATQDIPADLPPMVEFKTKADAIIKERWGVEVKHCCAMRGGAKLSYERFFFSKPKRSRYGEHIHGFPKQTGSWCKKLKYGHEIDLRRHFLSAYQKPEGSAGGWEQSTDSQQRTARGATMRSKYRPSEKQNGTYGFPYTAVGGWCHRLKDEALRTSRNYGFPQIKGNWCNSYLKRPVFKRPPATRR